jgi:hypothetical protein
MECLGRQPLRDVVAGRQLLVSQPFQDAFGQLRLRRGTGCGGRFSGWWRGGGSRLYYLVELYTLGA